MAIPTRPSGPNDAGSAAVDFVLVGSLLTLLFLAMLQLGIDVYVRSVMAACAADGARYAALANIDSSSVAGRRTDALIRQSLGRGFAVKKIVATQDKIDGEPVIDVAVTARLPVLAWFLTVGPTVHVTGHAIEEPAR